MSNPFEMLCYLPLGGYSMRPHVNLIALRPVLIPIEVNQKSTPADLLQSILSTILTYVSLNVTASTVWKSCILIQFIKNEFIQLRYTVLFL